MEKLHIEKTGSDRWYDHYCVTGLSVEEMNEIFNANDRRDALVDVMGRHDNDSWYGKNIAEAWRNGYGIYHIGHVGENLFVEVGNSCD